MKDHDVILVGGGLANCLIAWFLRERRPEISFTILEQGSTLGGNHTWSYYDTDLTSLQRETIAPLRAAHWDSYDVHFPDYSRRLQTPYNSISSRRLHDAITENLGDRIVLGHRAEILTPTRVSVDGREMSAPLVIDGRGWVDTGALSLAYQKFLGLEVRLAAPHGLTAPIVMDARVEQKDGYRFVYVLPLTDDMVLVEDTRYSDEAGLDRAALRDDAEHYIRARGWTIKSIEREETGVLPITLAGDIDRLLGPLEDGQPVSGLRAGLFHPTTGYSLPHAVRIADMLCGIGDLSNGSVSRAIARNARRNWSNGSYYRMLNRLMFLAARPAARYLILQRFYRLYQPLIERFYAGESSLQDKMRILTGKPPVKIVPAIRSLLPSAVARARAAA